jgi:hypothetical protein
MVDETGTGTTELERSTPGTIVDLGDIEDLGLTMPTSSYGVTCLCGVVGAAPDPSNRDMC